MARRRKKIKYPPVAESSVAIDQSSRREVAADIKMKVARHFAKKKWGVSFELGLSKQGSLRADVVAMAFNGYIVMVEVKSCVADFKSDSKWEQYLPFCNQYYFAFNAKTWKKIEPTVDFPPTIGVMVIDHDLKTIKIVKKSKKRDLDIETKLGMALRLAYRGAQFRSLYDVKIGGRFK